MKRIIIIFSMVLVSLTGMAQVDINNYKYILVPKQFAFQKTEDLYQLNGLTEFLFNKYGYEAYLMGETLPEELKNNSCLALRSEVVKVQGGVFKTKIEIHLKDCFGVLVMKSQIGESRKKEYAKAYNEALRNAFKTFQNLNYQYTPKESASLVFEEKKDLKGSLGVPAVPMVAKVSSTAEQIAVDTLGQNNNSEIYVAQAITYGFQLVNSEPKVVMILLKTAAKDVFIVKGKAAIVFKKDGKWMYSENKSVSISEESLNIKF